MLPIKRLWSLQIQNLSTDLQCLCLFFLLCMCCCCTFLFDFMIMAYHLCLSFSFFFFLVKFYVMGALWDTYDLDPKMMSPYQEWTLCHLNPGVMEWNPPHISWHGVFRSDYTYTEQDDSWFQISCQKTRTKWTSCHTKVLEEAPRTGDSPVYFYTFLKTMYKLQPSRKKATY